MKRIIFSLILFINISSLAQEEPFYEQIAFDFYSTKIIDSFPVRKKIRVYKYFFDFQNSIEINFNVPNCMKKNVKFEKIEEYCKEQSKIESKKFEINYSKLNKKKFKIRKSVKEKYPRLFITAPHRIVDEKEKNIFINIHVEESLFFKSIYHLKLNDKGQILNWCRDFFETIIIH